MNTSQQFPTKYDRIYIMLLDLDWSPHCLTSITNVTDYSTIKKIVDGFFDWFFNGIYCVPLILYNQLFSISIDEFLSIRWQVPSHTQHSQTLSWEFILSHDHRLQNSTLNHGLPDAPHILEKTLLNVDLLFILSRSLKMQSALDPLSDNSHCLIPDDNDN